MKLVIALAVVIVALLLVFILVPAPTPGEYSYSDLIRVDAATVENEIQSPLVITGEARGPWFFEANFPVTVLDENGAVVAEHYAEAQSEWMVEDFVPFSATIEFSKIPTTPTGILILTKANASGLPEHDDQFEIPIRFVTVNTVPITSEYDGKIVYGVSQDLDVEALQNDCNIRKGTFNTCGNTCEPKAQGCVQVCAFTCEY